MLRRMVRNTALAAAIALAGCRERAVAQPTPPTAPAPSPLSAPQRSAADCVAPLEGPGAREKLRERKGELRIGVMAGLKDADDDNLAVIKKLVGVLKRRGAGAESPHGHGRQPRRARDAARRAYRERRPGERGGARPRG